MTTVATVETAEKELADLQVEQEQLPARIGAAARAGDAGLVRDLRARGDDLPLLVLVARRAVLEARLAELAGQRATTAEELPAAKAAAEQRREEAETARLAWVVAVEVYGLASTAVGSIQNDLAGLAERMSQARTELDDVDRAVAERAGTPSKPAEPTATHEVTVTEGPPRGRTWG